MNISLLVSKFLKKDEKPRKKEVPDGFCPNCWGKTEYGGKFYDAVVNKNTLSSINQDKGWIQDYVERNLSGIMLVKKDDKLVCPNCKLTYTEEDLK